MMLVYILFALIFVGMTWLVCFLLTDCDFTLQWAARSRSKLNGLKDKNIWITGASSGIGEYFAYECARAGARVILSARRADQLEAVAKKCQGPHKPIVVPMDMLDIPNHASVLKSVLDQVGHIDILLLNAGRTQRALAESTALEVTREMMELNFFAQVALTNHVLPHFLSRRSGHFVVTSSVAGKMFVPVSSSYGATKHAIQGYYDSLRSEVCDRGIDVTLICPGPVESEIANNSFSGVPGQKGQTGEQNQKKMPTARCAYLMAIAVASKLDEVWISKHPVLLALYIYSYMPTIGRRLSKWIGPVRAQAFREGRDIYDVKILYSKKSNDEKKKQ